MGAPNRLTVNHIENPIGFDASSVVLSWWSGDLRAGEAQSAYQVQAATAAARLEEEPDLWDSGRVASARRLSVPYLGALPEAGQPAFWRVRTFDQAGEASAWSEVALFLPWHPDWLAASSWLCTPIAGSRSQGAPVPAFSRSFEAPEFSTAYLAVAALGALCVRVNGEAVAELLLAPGWNDFSREAGARLVDVSSYLHPGANDIEVLLGDGWYAGAVDGISREHYGRRPMFAAALAFDGLADGAELVTDAQWRCRLSAVLSSDVVQGEAFDARAAVDEFEVAPVVGKAPALALQPLASTPYSYMERVPLLHTLRQHRDTPDGLRRWSGQIDRCVIGHLSGAVRAEEGQHLILRSSVDPIEPGARVTETSYTAAGAEAERVQSIFALHAVRHLEVVGDIQPNALEELDLLQVGCNLTPVSGFDCDHPLLRRYFDFARRSLDNVLLDVPVQSAATRGRIGRLDAALPYLSALPYVFDMAAYLHRWVRMLSGAPVTPSPAVYPPVTTPSVHADVPLNRLPEPPSGDQLLLALVLARAAWVSYRSYADLAALEAAYEPVLQRLDGLEARHQDMICPVMLEGVEDAVVGTSFWFETARLAARLAGSLGRLGDMQRLEDQAQRVRSAFRRRFVTADGLMVGDALAANVSALALGLLEGSERQVAMARLVAQIENSGYRPVLPAALTSRLYDVLAMEDRLDIGYALLLNTSGSWMQPLVDGEAAAAEASAAGALDFLFRHVIGLQERPDLAEDGAGFRRVLVRPRPPLLDQFPEGLPLGQINGHFDSAHGRYEFAWRSDAQGFILELLVPCGCEADVVLPDGAAACVAAGAHSFKLSAEQGDDGIPVLEDTLGR